MNRTAWTDQIAAAKRDTQQVHAVLRLVCDAKHGTHDRVQEWVDRWRRSVPLTPGCTHARSPVTLVGILTDPPTVYCPECAVPAVQRWVDSHPDGCDSCGCKARTFHEIVLQVADVLHLFGHVCPACFAAIRERP